MLATLTKFYRLSNTTFDDRINTIYQFIKPFLNEKCLSLRNMEPLTYGIIQDSCDEQGICGQQMTSSDCASAQSDQRLCCPLKEPYNTIESADKQNRP